MQYDSRSGEAVKWAENEAYGFEDFEYESGPEAYGKEPRDPSEDRWETEFEVNNVAKDFF